MTHGNAPTVIYLILFSFFILEGFCAADSTKPSSQKKTGSTPAPVTTSAPTSEDTPPALSWTDRVKTLAHEKGYFEAMLFGGVSTPEAYESWWGGTSDYSAQQTLIHQGIGGIAAYRFSVSSVFGSKSTGFGGLLVDLRHVSHLSLYDDKIGNYRGYRFNWFSPVVGLLLDNTYLIRADLQFLGSYHFSKNTAEGKSAQFQRPLGYRVAALYRLGRWVGPEKLYLGAQIESLKFSQRAIEGIEKRDLSPAFSMTQFGLVVSYVF